MDMRLMKDRTSATNRPPRIAQPEVPAIGVVATADRGNELRTTGDVASLVAACPAGGNGDGA